MGTLFTGMDAMQGARFTPTRFAGNVGFSFAYGALVCPMQAMNGGRESAVHNFLSGATVGAIIVSVGGGIPFVSPDFFWRYPNVRPVMMGAGVYGSLGGAMAVFSGKPI